MKTIGSYEVRRTLGRGTTGVVFEVWDGVRASPLALKLVTQPTRDTPALLGRLQRDAQASASLGHPNIAAVVEVGEHLRQPFVATELVPGMDLGQVVRSPKPFPIEWVLDVWRQIAEGLAHAHRSGLFHLDLKPSDVRVTPTGEVKILDFGFCHLKARRENGPALGGVHYRAPEQVEGGRPDARTDVYSAAAVLYELAARRKPFPGGDFTTVVRNITRGRPDRAALPRTVFSPGFEAIVMKALSREPRHRYDSFEALHQDLVSLVREAAGRMRARALPAATAPDKEALYLELTAARAQEDPERALGICRKLLEADPEDERALLASTEIEAVLQDRELERLVGMALSYVAEGELALAARIAEKVERLAPWSPRYLQLQVYLHEESARTRRNKPTPPARPAHLQEVESLINSALDHFVGSDHARARASIERLLALEPDNRKALELLRILGNPR